MKAWDKSQTDPQIIYLFSFVLFHAHDYEMFPLQGF